MALELKIEKGSISSDCKTLTIDDNTGNYDATDNPGGYGAPNEVRANLYHKLFVTLKKTTGDTDVTVAAYNENTASQWTVTITEDGRYELFLFSTLAWASGTTYGLDHIAYDATTDKFYKSIQAANLNNVVTDAAWWEEATLASEFVAALDDSQPDTYSDIENVIELCRSKNCKARAVLNAGCGCIDECTLGEYRKIELMIASAEVNEALLNFEKAQRLVEELQVFCDNVDETDCGCSNC